MAGNPQQFPYIHGFSEEEQRRLYYQAEFAEHTIFQDIDFSRQSQVLEVGSGVGAQSAILLRRFPKLALTGIDASEKQLAAAEANLNSLPYATGRYRYLKMDAANMDFDANAFDGAFLCWVLEHVKEPARVLSEVRRVLRPGSPIVVNEVMNSSFFLDPYSPGVWQYWMKFNDFQYDQAGDPFVGAKLGNLLLTQGYRQIQTKVKTWHFDNRQPQKRREAIRFWKELLLSGAEQLIQANYIDTSLVEQVKTEFAQVESNPNAVFFYSFIQAQAKVE